MTFPERGPRALVRPETVGGEVQLAEGLVGRHQAGQVHPLLPRPEVVPLQREGLRPGGEGVSWKDAGGLIP